MQARFGHKAIKIRMERFLRLVICNSERNYFNYIFKTSTWLYSCFQVDNQLRTVVIIYMFSFIKGKTETSTSYGAWKTIREDLNWISKNWNLRPTQNCHLKKTSLMQWEPQIAQTTDQTNKLLKHSLLISNIIDFTTLCSFVNVSS